MKLTDAQYDVLQSLYQVCYDEAGHIQACGRNNCIRLIQFLDDLTGTKNLYGDIDRGFMNDEAIQSFIKSIEMM